jgi:carbon storage regulator
MEVRFSMLVLSRKENERIRLGDSIIVTIVRVSGDKVRLGIQAPPDVLVLRDELETYGKPDAPAAIVVDVPVAPRALAG